jgi:hypothetical protein
MRRVPPTNIAILSEVIEKREQMVIRISEKTPCSVPLQVELSSSRVTFITKIRILIPGPALG